MRAVATFAFAPWLAGSGNTWLSTAHFLACAKASIEHAQKHFGAATVYTDSIGADIFKQIVDCDVVVSLDRVHEDLTTEIWVASKFSTYAAQTAPFVHFDLDLIFHDPLPEQITRAAVGCQGLETTTGRWYNINETVQAYGRFSEWGGVDVWSIKPPNVGFVVLNDKALNREWCLAFENFVETHRSRLNTLAVKPNCCLLEQHLLGVLMLKRSIEPVTLLHDGMSAVSRQYSHFVGNLKTDKFALQKLKSYLTPQTLAVAKQLDGLRK